jgi:glycine cleavage system H protein
MESEPFVEVAGYRLPVGRYYEAATHLWAQRLGYRQVRLGFDPLGREASGDIVQLSFAPVGTRLKRGEAFGNVEAAKLVGPLTSPLSGTVVAHNESLATDPAAVNEDPNAHWLLELELENPEELSLLVFGEKRLRAWFADEVDRFRRQGVIAE